MKDRPAPAPERHTAGRSADARGDTGTAADDHRMGGRPRDERDVGGMPSTVDAGMRDRLGTPGDATTQRPVGREPVQDGEARQPPGGRAVQPAPGSSPRPAAADEEGPLESLGKAISEPVTGAPRSTPGGDKTGRR
jgi:hypothetical protein